MSVATVSMGQISAAPTIRTPLTGAAGRVVPSHSSTLGVCPRALPFPILMLALPIWSLADTCPGATTATIQEASAA